MDEQEIASAIGWMMVASGALAVMLSSLTRYGYRATSAGLVLGCLGHSRALAYARPVQLLPIYPLQVIMPLFSARVRLTDRVRFIAFTVKRGFLSALCFFPSSRERMAFASRSLKASPNWLCAACVPQSG
jgi:hypothetical protein